MHMKNTARKHFLTFGLLTAVCAVSIALVPKARGAEVSEDDFKALKEEVRKLREKVDKMEKLHETDEQLKQKDQEQIKQLQDKLGETQTTAAEAARKADVATQVQPVYRVPDDSGSVNKNFMILGDAEVQYAKFPGAHGTFLFADFAPIFLYRAGDRILFEAGFDTTIQNGSNPANGHDSGTTTSFDLSFAQLNYVLNDYVTVAAGDMLLPLGTYAQRTAGGWVNKIPDDPLPRDLLPGTGIGIQLLGAFPLGESGQILNYSVYGVNGPSSSDGTGSPDQLDLGGNVGLHTDNTVGNLHGNPSGGGRLGWFFPFGPPHYDFELGGSIMSGEWDDAGKHLWTGGAVDASLHLGPYLEVKGEYIRTKYGSTSGNINPSGWWIQGIYKLAGLRLELPGINNLELVGRYDKINDKIGNHTERETIGMVYYFNNTLLLEGAYEFQHGTTRGDVMLLQLGYGF
jgi:hypothetical protein